tara:strand:- start:405 stop:857 length:453 start_codon:yes stop_codon:yes gene_type:complete
MKYFYTLIFIFIINCSGNKVSNYHGSKSLENEFEKLIVNKTNKNDIIKIIGPPSTISEFDKNKWFYIERLKTNQSLIKLGTQKIKKNNVLILELKNNGKLKSKKMLNLKNMNDLKFAKQTTEKDFQNDSILYNVFSSLREKINAPIKNKQ